METGSKLPDGNHTFIFFEMVQLQSIGNWKHILLKYKFITMCQDHLWHFFVIINLINLYCSSVVSCPRRKNDLGHFTIWTVPRSFLRGDTLQYYTEKSLSRLIIIEVILCNAMPQLQVYQCLYDGLYHYYFVITVFLGFWHLTHILSYNIASFSNNFNFIFKCCVPHSFWLCT